MRWVFTLNNFTPLDEERLQSAQVLDETKYLIYGRETGDSGTPHLQGFVIFKVSLRFAAAKTLLCNDGRIHIEPARGKNKQASDYCKKSDPLPFISGSYGSQGARNDIEDFKNWVLEQERTPSRSLVATEYPGLFVRYERRLMELVRILRPIRITVDGQYREWQLELKTKLDADPDDRKIVFVVDPIGGLGKSWFIRKFLSENPDSVQFLSIGKRDDIAHAIDPEKSHFFFNVPRGQLEFLQYSVLEQLKDRMVFSPKYESQTKYLHSIPHVVVFTNEEPDYNKLTNDRYDLFRPYE